MTRESHAQRRRRLRGIESDEALAEPGDGELAIPSDLGDSSGVM